MTETSGRDRLLAKAVIDGSPRRRFLRESSVLGLHAANDQPVKSSDFHGGLSSAGHWPSIQVRAFCQCGWSGPNRQWEAGTKTLEQADLDEHLAASGHTPFSDGVPTADGLHLACDHFHDFQHSCPAPHDSVRGRVERVMQSSLRGTEMALDRLRAVDELRTWLDDEEGQAVIGARLARATWAEMGAAVGISRQGAWNRWGPMIKRYEEAGLLDQASTPPPHEPLDPTAGALTDARSWCRWCGHRVISSPAGDGWVHHVNDGGARIEGIMEVPDCPGDEPWPSDAEWPQ